MNIEINVKVTDYEERSALRPAYRGLNAAIEYEGGFSDSMNSVSSTDVVSFVESVLNEVIGQLIRRQEEPSDINVTGVELTEGAQTFLVDKFTSDPLINSVTFE